MLFYGNKIETILLIKTCSTAVVLVWHNPPANKGVQKSVARCMKSTVIVVATAGSSPCHIQNRQIVPFRASKGKSAATERTHYFPASVAEQPTPPPVSTALLYAAFLDPSQPSNPLSIHAPLPPPAPFFSFPSTSPRPQHPPPSPNPPPPRTASASTEVALQKLPRSRQAVPPLAQPQVAKRR